VVSSQVRMGVDIAMVLDECPAYPVEQDAADRAWRRTLEWERRARAVWPGGPGGLFGIVQGCGFRDLRERAAADLAALDFDGCAIGGVSVGEPEEQRRAAVEWTAPCLPEGKPRYLMGVGTPEDILHAVRWGVDLFDCVMPARNGRHGVLFSGQGPIKIKNSRYRDDPRPVDPECACPACARVSRAFLHHLFRAGEITALVLATLHNVRFYLDFMGRLRQAIQLGALTSLVPPPANRALEGTAGVS
jgi:queuine tRNA-ribosyltransferase